MTSPETKTPTPRVDAAIAAINSDPHSSNTWAIFYLLNLARELERETIEMRDVLIVRKP